MVDIEKLRLPKTGLSDKERAVVLARMIIRKQNLRIALTASESVLVARELLKALGLKE